MALGSLGFLAGLCLGVIVFQLTPWRWLRRLLFVGANVAFLGQFLSDSWIWVWMAALLVGSYAALRCLRPHPFRAALALFVIVCVGGFAWLKQYYIVQFISLLMGWPPNWGLAGVELIGLSYMLFRLIHVAVDQWQGQIETFSFLSYVNYQIDLFTLVAGPIQRYNDFHKFWVEMDVQPHEPSENLSAWNRVVLGTIKMAVIAPAIQAGYSWLSVCPGVLPDSVHPMQRLMAQFYGYPLFLYFNFSGYTAIAVAGAHLLGLELPENFNHPFLARNVIDFWNRWHMSLTRWIRDYVFMTSYKAAAEKFPRRAKQIGYFLIFVSLVAVGQWHGTTMGFALFGVIHGLGAAANQIYGDLIRAWRGAAWLKRYLQWRVIHLIAVVLTFHFVCFSFLFFALDAEGAMTLLEAAAKCPWINYPMVWAVLGIVVSVTVLTLWVLTHKDSVQAWIDRASQSLMPQTMRLYLLLITQTALVALWLLICWAAQQPEPIVVYQRF